MQSFPNGNFHVNQNPHIWITFFFKTSGTFTLIGILRTMSFSSSCFYHARFALLELKMESSNLYLWNNLAFATTFFLSRVMPIIPIWIHFFHQIEKPEWNQLGLSNILICILSGIFDALNIFWFSKIFKKILEFLQKPVKNGTSKDVDWKKKFQTE